MKLETPMRNKEKLIQQSNFPLLASLCINFLEKSNQRTKKNTETRKKTYSSLWGASNDGVRYSVLHSIVESSIQDSLDSCIGNLTPTDDNEIYLRNQFITRYKDKLGVVL